MMVNVQVNTVAIGNRDTGGGVRDDSANDVYLRRVCDESV